MAQRGISVEIISALPVLHCAPLQSCIPSPRPLSGYTAGTRRHTNKRTSEKNKSLFLVETGQDLGVAKVCHRVQLRAEARRRLEHLQPRCCDVLPGGTQSGAGLRYEHNYYSKSTQCAEILQAANIPLHPRKNAFTSDN